MVDCLHLFNDSKLIVNSRDTSIVLMIFGGIALYVLTQSNNSQGGIIGDAENAIGNVMSTVRGFRNNNPGNIRKTTTVWQGLSASQNDPLYFQFQSMDYGIRAIAKIILTYNQRGVNSVDAIISTWAPDIENNTVAYINAVSADMGVSQSDSLDVSDFDTMASLVRAIIKHENGAATSALISDDTLHRGISMAYNS